ncbi:PBP1A family penicillin-binding protein [Pediococcus siamensis]|uniref:PBP1A family penicillin-binding protein n=1 Tax=Pediococcus siamensis TaxID=381829 RepID=UPI00399EFE8B
MNTNNFFATLKRWFKQLGHFLSPYWHRVSAFLRRYWRRFQLTRWLVIVFLSFFLVMSAYLTYQAKTANVGDLKSALEKPTVVYDAKNQKAGSLYSQKGTWVKLKNISVNVQNAVISTEDRGFYKEYGFSIKGIGRAALLYVMNKVMGRNYISGGGSTLTQQLVKNAFLSQQQTFTRKAKELFLSIEVENVYTKSEILEMYLNNAYFGNGVWGVQDAAKRYFGVSASQLTVPQSAVLAGMLTSPSAYNPEDHPAASKKRRNVVLSLMAENNKITTAQAKAYQKTALVTSNGYSDTSDYKYPYYFDAVINEAISRYGLTESDIMNRGYKIYTYLNQSDQTSMQNEFKTASYFPADASDGTKVQAASIAINPKTGGVVAVVGGRGKHVFRGFNRATQMKRQPGSTLKPIAVYAPALASGYSYDSTLQDKLQSYGTNNYRPKNYNNQYDGTIPMYKALAESRNAPAVWLLNKIGVSKGYASAEKFGLNLGKSDKNLALALGGLSTGVSPYQMASAYTAFANNGELAQTGFIRKIVDSSGKTIVNNTPQKKRIISTKVAKEMTSMMIGVYSDSYGTGVNAKPYGYTIAGKTGSTEVDGASTSDATSDEWMIGYTRDVVVATWEGFDDTTKTNHLENLSGVGLSTLFKSEMESILPNTAGTSFGTTNAASLAAAENSSSGSGIWDSIQNGASSAEKQFSKGTESFKEKASEWVDKAKSFFGD